MVGPSGSGKTYMVSTLAKFLGVPVATATATSFVQASYRGTAPESVVKSLLERAENDPRKAEKGIVFLMRSTKSAEQVVAGSSTLVALGCKMHF